MDGFASPADERLVGYWRHTESMYSDGFSMVTDTYFRLDSNGRFSRSSRTESSASSSQSPEEYGSWWVENERLYLQFDGGYSDYYDYEAYPDQLYLPNERLKLWDRM